MIIQKEVSCKNCRYQGHSGAFTPGGAKPICNHSKAMLAFYPGTAEEYEAKHKEWQKAFNRDSVSTAAGRRKLLESSPDHYKFRILDLDKPEPPEQCPLREFEVEKHNMELQGEAWAHEGAAKNFQHRIQSILQKIDTIGANFDNVELRIQALTEFYWKVAHLTVDHEVVGEDIASVSPNKLGGALAEVDPDWYSKLK
jgi:hypothetical protein